ncbi:MAG: ATP-binding protein [Nanoarchaeota archaeon]
MNQFKKIIAEWMEKEIPILTKREIPVKLNSDILAIIGPRRVGKTYLMFQLINELLKENKKEEILFVDFEDNRLVGVKDSEWDNLFLAHTEMGYSPIKYLFFDEIQQMNNWSKFVRRLHNQNKYKIILSGSSSKLLSKEIASELRGRYKSIFVTPFSFSEFLHLRGFVINQTTEFTSKKGELLKLFLEYLLYGGYPEIIKEPASSEKKQKAAGYYETVFYRDLVERHKITNYEILELLMNYLLNNPTHIFSITGFEKILRSRQLEVSKKTISLFFKYLDEAFFVYPIEEFSYSAKKRLMRPKKAYLVDNGLITFLSMQFSPDNGILLENLVLGQLKRKEKAVFFFNEKMECDFVIKEGAKITQAIQVCWELNENSREREIKGLLEALDYFNLSEGLILTYDQEEKLVKDGKKIMVMPVWKWLVNAV